MTSENESCSSGLLCYALFGLAALIIVGLTNASAQYQSSYPYSRSPAAPRQRSYSAMGVGGFNGNPYKTSRVASTGLPVSGHRHSYYGGGSSRGSLGYHAPTKPFANLHRPQPLISSREAARIEVARGLWH